MESSGKWAPDTQPCLPCSLLAFHLLLSSVRLPSVARTVWRNSHYQFASAGPKAAREEGDAGVHHLFCFSLLPFIPSHFCLFPFTRSIFPVCFQDVSMEAEKTNHHNTLPMETPGLGTPGVSICFHGG